ncbi:MAG TPA: hypothetical protein VFW87_04280 [Pirellulales bacterium]|nr:hypothetical protein [Pirellulales bacterium]
MNKAFVKEPEDTGDRHCPRCGSLGVAVGSTTLDAQLPPDERRKLGESAWFCPYPRCEVGYFDSFDRWVGSDLLLHPSYPKDPTAPLCPCFDFTCEQVEADVAEQGAQRVKQLLARSKSPEARCTTMSPSGQCCMPEVQKYFFRLRGQA